MTPTSNSVLPDIPPVARSAVTAPVRHPARVIVPLSIGNALEWFDIVMYGYLAATIAKVFFPAENEYNGLLIVLGTFGASYAMRPIGSILLGAYADKAGRRKALNLSIRLMLLGTMAIAFAPTYQQAGVTGAVIVVIAKLVQGFSAGGEYGSSTALLVEQDPQRRGFFGSWQVASQGLTVVLAALFGYFLNVLFTPGQLEGWAWRIPFIFGLSIGPVAIYIRRHLKEGEEFSAAGTAAPSVAQSLSQNRGRILTALGLITLSTTTAYTMLYMPTYAMKYLHFPASASFFPTIVMGVLQAVLAPVFGGLSDRYGRARVMVPAACVLMIGVVPGYLALMQWPTMTTLILVEAFIGVSMTAYTGPLPAAMAELFPVKLRGLGLSLSYSLGVAVFGGFAPFASQALIARTGMVIAPAFVLMLAVVLSAISLVFACRYGLHNPAKQSTR